MPDPDAAWETARPIALDAMSVDEGRPVDWRNSHVEVKDAGGEIVLEFPFLEAVAGNYSRPRESVCLIGSDALTR